MFTLEGPGGKQALTLKQLKALPAVQYTTWHPQLRRFFRYEGVPLRDLAALGGLLGKDLRLHASNNFVSTIHAQDYLQEQIMLAYLADGKPIPVMEKGPLTVVLPPRPERLSTPAYSGAWVWVGIRLTPAPAPWGALGGLYVGGCGVCRLVCWPARRCWRRCLPS